MLYYCWPAVLNIGTTLCQCLVLAGYRPPVMLTWLSSYVEPMSGQCWLTVCYAGTVFTRRWFNVSCFVSFIQSQHWWQRHRKRWASVTDVGPALIQHWINATCFHWTGKILNHHVNVRQWWESDGRLYAICTSPVLIHAEHCVPQITWQSEDVYTPNQA